MNITIEDNRKILDIQEEFNKQFPFLRIGFLSTPKLQNRSAIHKIVHYTNLTIGECRSIHNTGQISIEGLMTVTELQKQFKETYGLNIQLLRKSVNVWLDTSVTDSWTLIEQNQQGEALSKLIA